MYWIIWIAPGSKLNSLIALQTIDVNSLPIAIEKLTPKLQQFEKIGILSWGILRGIVLSPFLQLLLDQSVDLTAAKVM